VCWVSVRCVDHAHAGASAKSASTPSRAKRRCARVCAVLMCACTQCMTYSLRAHRLRVPRSKQSARRAMTSDARATSPERLTRCACACTVLCIVSCVCVHGTLPLSHARAPHRPRQKLVARRAPTSANERWRCVCVLLWCCAHRVCACVITLPSRAEKRLEASRDRR
jgi:hypothetical protein